MNVRHVISEADLEAALTAMRGFHTGDLQCAPQGAALPSAAQLRDAENRVYLAEEAPNRIRGVCVMRGQRAIFLNLAAGRAQAAAEAFSEAIKADLGIEVIYGRVENSLVRALLKASRIEVRQVGDDPAEMEFR